MFCRLLEHYSRNDDIEGLEEVLSGDLTQGVKPSVDDCETGLIRSAARGFKQCVSRLLSEGADPDCQDPDGETPLHAAVAHGHLEIVNLLMNNKCDINAKTHDHRTALHMAVWSDSRQMAKCLLDKGCDISVHDSYGDTATMLCARRGMTTTTLMRMLLRHDKNINTQNKEGDTALIHAARYGRSANTRVLLRAGASVNVNNMWGLSPLHYACCGNFPDLIPMLLEAGADVNVTESSGRSMLHYLAQHNQVASARSLISKGCNVNHRDNDGNSCLMEALKGHHDAMTAMLVLEASCDVHHIGKMTMHGSYVQCGALDYAVHVGHFHVARFLRATGSSLVVIASNDEIPSDILQWTSSPRTLKSWCRVQLRNHLGCQLMSSGPSLPMPPALMDYIQFKECAITMI